MKKYKDTVDHNNVSGNGRKSFKFFNKMDEILRKDVSVNPELVLDAEIIRPILKA